MRARRRTSVGRFGLVALLGVAALLAFCSRHRAVPPEPVAVRAPAPALSPMRLAVTAPVVAPAPEADPATVTKRKKPLIEAFEVTPERVCVDDEVLASVRLRADAQIAKVAIRGRPGARGVFRFTEPGTVALHAMADDWQDGMDAREVTIRVEECPPKPRLELSWRQVGPGVFRFAARGVHMPEVPVAASWSFGDGGPASSAALEVVHSYALREQSRPQSSFLVTVTASGPDGSSYQAHAALYLANESDVTRRNGHAFLPVVASQFPTRRGEGWALPFQTRSLFDAPGAFDRAHLMRLSCDTGEALDAVSAPASELLDHRALAAGGVESYQLQLPDRLIGSGVCAVELRLDGSAADEPFTAMLGLSLGVPSDATVVRDPALLARIARARKTLGRDSVTAAELSDVAPGH